MKKIFLIIAIFLLTAAASQAQEKNPAKSKGKTEYSFLWGAFKSKEYKGKSFDFQFDTPKKGKNSYARDLYAVDTTKYEKKRALWGVIQWIEKKEKSKTK
ncbi:MAG TPA: hypothetical protein VF677_02500 [Flavobacterium sp.]|jgi:hypothetical protein